MSTMKILLEDFKDGVGIDDLDVQKDVANNVWDSYCIMKDSGRYPDGYITACRAIVTEANERYYKSMREAGY